MFRSHLSEQLLNRRQEVMGTTTVNMRKDDTRSLFVTKATVATVMQSPSKHVSFMRGDGWISRCRSVQIRPRTMGTLLYEAASQSDDCKVAISLQLSPATICGSQVTWHGLTWHDTRYPRMGGRLIALWERSLEKGCSVPRLRTW